MSKTVKVQITVDITIRLFDESIDPSEVIQEMDYDFTSQTDSALITGMEILSNDEPRVVNF
jgi:hypothetical protein